MTSRALEPTGALRLELNHMLSRIFGSGNASVVLYAPEKGAHTSSFQHAVRAGPPLSTSGVVVQSTGPGKATSTYRTALTNNQNSVTNTHSVGESVPGGVSSAAVLVNTARTSLTPLATREMKTFLHQALGIPVASVTVVGIPGAPLTTAPSSFGLSLPLGVGAGFTLLIILGWLWRRKKQRRRTTEPSAAQHVQEPAPPAMDSERLAMVIRRLLEKENKR
ncbi:MAG: hypothetical protein ACYCYO_01600 [Bacilli bacterium]